MTTGDGADSAKSSSQHELDDARAQLVSLALLLPADHPTIGEFTSKVSRLESATVAEIPMAERLRRLLQDGIKLAKQKEAADAAVSAAVAAVQAATKTLKDKVQCRDEATNAHNANLLEVAAMTRPSRPSEVDMSPVQALRSEIEGIDPAKLLENGITGEKLTQFFIVFTSLAAALKAAKPDPPVAPVEMVPVAPVEAVAPVEVVPAPVVHAAPAPVVRAPVDKAAAVAARVARQAKAGPAAPTGKATAQPPPPTRPIPHGGLPKRQKTADEIGMEEDEEESDVENLGTDADMVIECTDAASAAIRSAEQTADEPAEKDEVKPDTTSVGSSG